MTNGVDHGASDNGDDDGGEEWKEVGPRNKAVVTHSNEDSMSTPISSIFGGLLRSSLVTTKTQSATIEPFFTVPLNVQVCRCRHRLAVSCLCPTL